MRRIVGLCALLAVAACGRAEIDSRAQPLDAYCSAMVVGTGVVDVETDYLPHVVACENGAASQTALEAQAVAARSYLYYRLDTAGMINDGTGDQVYSCGRPPDAQHYMAVEATSGTVLQYQGTQVAAFYVAGALQDPPECSGGTDDPTDTERYVTYNEGLSGDALIQTTLGFVDPSNYANRGCMSQNGSDCLSDDGANLDRILRFYYGADIEVVDAVGACIVGGGDPDAGPVGIDPDADLGPGAGGGVDGGCSVGTSTSTAPVFAIVFALLLGARRRRAPQLA
jgi:hypothetical protein